MARQTPYAKPPARKRDQNTVKTTFRAYSRTHWRPIGVTNPVLIRNPRAVLLLAACRIPKSDRLLALTPRPAPNRHRRGILITLSSIGFLNTIFHESRMYRLPHRWSITSEFRHDASSPAVSPLNAAPQDTDFPDITAFESSCTRSFQASATCVCNDRTSRASGAGAQFE